MILFNDNMSFRLIFNEFHLYYRIIFIIVYDKSNTITSVNLPSSVLFVMLDKETKSGLRVGIRTLYFRPARLA